MPEIVKVNGRLSSVTVASVEFQPRSGERFHKTNETAAITTPQWHSTVKASVERAGLTMNLNNVVDITQICIKEKKLSPQPQEVVRRCHKVRGQELWLG